MTGATRASGKLGTPVHYFDSVGRRVNGRVIGEQFIDRLGRGSRVAVTVSGTRQIATRAGEIRNLIDTFE